MRREGLLSASGVLLIGIIALMTLHEWEDHIPGLSQQQIEAPALIIEGMDSDTFTEQGTLHYRLRSTRIVQFDHDDSIVGQNPILELYSPKPTWTIRALQGSLTENGQLLTFSNDVQAINHESEGEIKLNSAELHFYPRDELLKIPVEANILHETGRTRAGSLEANMSTGIIELRNGVESTYDKP